MAGVAPRADPAKKQAAPFQPSWKIWRAYLRSNAAEIRKQSGFEEIAAAVDRLAGDAEAVYRDLEDLEHRLTALEDKMIAIARTRQTEEELLAGPPRTRSAASRRIAAK